LNALTQLRCSGTRFGDLVPAYVAEEQEKRWASLGKTVFGPRSHWMADPPKNDFPNGPLDPAYRLAGTSCRWKR